MKRSHPSPLPLFSNPSYFLILFILTRLSSGNLLWRERTWVRTCGLGLKLCCSEREAGQGTGRAGRGRNKRVGRGLRAEEAGWVTWLRQPLPWSGTVLKMNSSAPEAMTGQRSPAISPRKCMPFVYTLGGSGPRTLFCAFGLEANNCA